MTLKSVWIPFQIWQCPICKNMEKYEGDRLLKEFFCTQCGVRRERIQ